MSVSNINILYFLPLFFLTTSKFLTYASYYYYYYFSLPWRRPKTFSSLLFYFLFMTELSDTKCIAVAIHCSQIALFTPELLSSVVASITCNWRHCFKTLFIVSWGRKERCMVEIVSVTLIGDGYEMDGRKKEHSSESVTLVTYTIIQPHLATGTLERVCNLWPNVCLIYRLLVRAIFPSQFWIVIKFRLISENQLGHVYWSMLVCTWWSQFLQAQCCPECTLRVVKSPIGEGRGWGSISNLTRRVSESYR